MHSDASGIPTILQVSGNAFSICSNYKWNEIKDTDRQTDNVYFLNVLDCQVPNQISFNF